jgi:hypothetical protein
MGRLKSEAMTGRQGTCNSGAIREKIDKLLLALCISMNDRRIIGSQRTTVSNGIEGLAEGE